jgi:endonuclease/exonuclease/phosphatase family metal-dependent hydrolase
LDVKVDNVTPVGAVTSLKTARWATPAPAAAAPAIAGDRFNRTDKSIQVMTFNTAGDGARHTNEALIPQSAAFQKVVTGAPDAAIVACQETTKPLSKTLRQLAKNGNFQVVYPGKAWLPSLLLSSPFVQGNMVLIPKRYQIEGVQNVTYAGRAGTFWQALKGVVLEHHPVNDLLVALQRRGYESIRLKDTVTGKRFTVIATHIAGDDAIRRKEEPQLLKAIKQAENAGPVVIMGDFNTASLDTAAADDKNVVDFWAGLAPAKLTAIGPKGRAGATAGSQDIDHILVKGFTERSSDVLSGNKMTIPGRPDADQVSDHFAKVASLDF